MLAWQRHSAPLVSLDCCVHGQGVHLLVFFPANADIVLGVPAISLSTISISEVKAQGLNSGVTHGDSQAHQQLE